MDSSKDNLIKINMQNKDNQLEGINITVDSNFKNEYQSLLTESSLKDEDICHKKELKEKQCLQLESQIKLLLKKLKKSEIERDIFNKVSIVNSKNKEISDRLSYITKQGFLNSWSETMYNDYTKLEIENCVYSAKIHCFKLHDDNYAINFTLFINPILFKYNEKIVIIKQSMINITSLHEARKYIESIKNNYKHLFVDVKPIIESGVISTDSGISYFDSEIIMFNGILLDGFTLYKTLKEKKHTYDARTSEFKLNSLRFAQNNVQFENVYKDNDGRIVRQYIDRDGSVIYERS